MEKKSFVGACKAFFGYKPGQTLADFAAELKALTPKDREELKPMLSEALGCEVE